MVDKVVADGIPEIQDTEMLTGQVRCDNPIRRSPRGFQIRRF
jgi:hypothetical protein